jgi:NADH-quinone oxidoreductase subunit D
LGDKLAEERKIDVHYSRCIIPIGPIYPALKEPVNIKVTLNKEKIADVDFRLGYAHRGIEALAQKRNIIQSLYLVERICGICSHSHATCYIQAIEEIGGIHPPERAVYIRTLMMELERIHSHMLWLGVTAYGIGFDTFFMYAMRIREQILDIFEEATGNRVHHSLNTIGGIRADLTSHIINKIQAFLSEVEKTLQFMLEILHGRTVENRLKGIGILRKEDAEKFCVVGPIARASGIEYDVRTEDPYAAYEELKNEFSKIISSKGDAFARAEVRILEVRESSKIIKAILDNLPTGPIRTDGSALKLSRGINEGEAVSRVEAPRGELVYYAKTNGKEGLKRLKIRTPTLANIICLKTMLNGLEVADIPVVVASIDPCISCADR